MLPPADPANPGDPMSKQSFATLALLLATPVAIATPLAIAACGSEEADPVPQPVTFVSFNAGLATNFVAHAPERLSHVISAVKDLKADVVCLQEVWSDEDTAAIIAGVKGTFAHEFHAKTEDDATSAALPIACTPGESDPLKACVAKNCSADPNDPCSEEPNLTECGLGFCGPQIGKTSTKCFDCIKANIGLGAGGIFETCAKEGGGKYAFKGRNGLLLLSRKPLTDTGHTVLKSATNRRAVLHATARFDSSKAHLFCTHLTAGLSSIEYSGEFGTWEKEQAQQIDAVIALVDTRAGAEAAVLIGDMNCGPTLPGLEPEMEDNYKKFLTAGFKNPYADAAGAKCTWCDDNKLHGEADAKGAGGSIIDHILMKNVDAALATARTARVIDGVVEIDVACKKKPVHVSDHYGLSVELDPGF